nr:MAG TPA: hypothetical protein [Caudoviricetes sp.]
MPLSAASAAAPGSCPPSPVRFPSKSSAVLPRPLSSKK